MAAVAGLVVAGSSMSVSAVGAVEVGASGAGAVDGLAFGGGLPSDAASPGVRPARGYRPAHRRRGAPVRLTRRGRLVFGLVLVGLAIGVATLLAPAISAAPPATPVRAVTVHHGDTLWSIATSALPDESPYAAVDRVRVLNHLPDDEIEVGQQLLLPAP